MWLGHGLINQRVGPQGVTNAIAAYLSAVELRPSTDALLAAAFSQLNLFPGVPAETGTRAHCGRACTPKAIAEPVRAVGCAWANLCPLCVGGR